MSIPTTSDLNAIRSIVSEFFTIIVIGLAGVERVVDTFIKIQKKLRALKPKNIRRARRAALSPPGA
jgi:hypothetical protein